MRRGLPKRPARPAAELAPSTSPMSMIDVTSAKTGAASAAGWKSPVQNGVDERSTPAVCKILPPQREKAQVMVHGWPATRSVARFSTASATAPAVSDQGPRKTRSRREIGGAGG